MNQKEIKVENTFNEILSYRKNQLEKLQNYLINDLNLLDITCIKIFGSATNILLFDKDYSDIDIIAYTNKIKRNKIDNLISYINCVGGNFKDKSPIYLEDFITPRIEYFYNIDGIDFDINIFPNQIWGYNEIKTKVLHDALDIFFGGMNKYAISLYGKFEPLEKIKNEIYPFYSDEIRNSRLDILENRIVEVLGKIKNKLDKGENDVFEYVFKTRNYFIKWLFIYNKVYPLDLNKHLEYQLNTFLDMDNAEIDNILLKGDVKPKELTLRYIKTVEKNIGKRTKKIF